MSAREKNHTGPNRRKIVQHAQWSVYTEKKVKLLFVVRQENFSNFIGQHTYGTFYTLWSQNSWLEILERGKWLVGRKLNSLQWLWYEDLEVGERKRRINASLRGTGQAEDARRAVLAADRQWRVGADRSQEVGW